MMHKPTSPSLLHVSTDQAPAITARLHLHTEGPFCSGIKVEISVSKLRQKHCTNSRGVGSNCRQPLIKCTKCMREMGGCNNNKKYRKQKCTVHTRLSNGGGDRAVLMLFRLIENKFAQGSLKNWCRCLQLHIIRRLYYSSGA